MDNHIPAWYTGILAMLQTGQSEIFVLTGDVSGYPVYPGETLPMFLERYTVAKQSAVDRQLCITLSPATGLVFPDTTAEDLFNRAAPEPETANPFGADTKGDMLQSFERLHTYFNQPDAPALGVIIQDGDLLFDREAPMIEPEKTMLSYIRRWSERPLVNTAGRPHRIFILAAAEKALRPALLQGRITPVSIPLPDYASRLAFLQALDTNDELTYEKGLDQAMVARTTGALNLIQIEDIIYQAHTNGGEITRAMIQSRKDLLVKQTFGGIIAVEYPDADWSAVVGFEPLKTYFRDYVYPKLRDGDSRCPKGCVLSGPPGTGKTALARLLAAALKLPLVSVFMDRIKDKYVGESNKNMAKLGEGIMAIAPAIVLLDEIDKIMPAGDDSTGVSQEILGQLQTFLSDIPRGTAFFVATTNYPSRIPRALLRPGRFEQVIPLLPQHLDDRCGTIRGKVLTTLAERLGIPLVDVDANQIGKSAVDHTGADIEKLLIEADREATEAGRTHVIQSDLMAALDYVVPTLATTQPMVDEALEFCSNRRFIPASIKSLAGKPASQVDRTRKPRTVQGA